MNRRAFVTGLGAVLAAPLGVGAQRSEKVWRVAIVFAALGTTAEMQENHDYKLLIAELRGFGYVEGRNLIVERRVGQGRPSQYPQLAREVVGLEPDVIYAASGPLIRALKDATHTIPIVGVTADFRAGGFVQSLARPGTNVTGFSISPGEEIFGKRIQLLREAVPSLATVAFLTPRPSWEGRFGGFMRSMAQEVGVTPIGATLNDPINEPEYERAFAGLLRSRPEALVVTDHPENYVNQRAIVKLAADARLPAVYPFREAVAAGGFMAYSADVSDIHRQVAGYIDRILRGEKAAYLLIQQPSKFHLGLNLKAAKALGLTIPPSLLLRADQVIE